MSKLIAVPIVGTNSDMLTSPSPSPIFPQIGRRTDLLQTETWIDNLLDKNIGAAARAQ